MILLLLLLQSFLSEIALSGENGGGGNRTRVTSHPEAASTQDFSSAASVDEPRPRACNTSSTCAGSEPTARDAALLRDRVLAWIATRQRRRVGVWNGSRVRRWGGELASFPALHLMAAGSTREDTSPETEVRDSRACRHPGDLDGRHPHQPERPLGNQHAGAFARAHAGDRGLAFGSRVEGARLDRQAGVGLGPVRLVSGASRLLLRWIVQLRDPAGEPMPERMARTPRHHVARTGLLADSVHQDARLLWLALRRPTVRRPADSACVPTSARLVLTGALT